MNDSKNKNSREQVGQAYQYTRAIRFKLEPQRQSQCFQSKRQIPNSKPDLSETVKLLSKVHAKLTDLLFYKDKEDNKETNNEKESQSKANGEQEDQSKKLKWSKKLSVSKNWLTVWHKNIFHASIKNQGNRDGKYKLQDLKPIHEYLKTWLDDWEKQLEQLKNYSKKPEESQVRQSDKAYLIRWFLNQQKLSYIQSFLNEVHTQVLDKKIQKLKDQLEDLREKLKTAEKHYLSTQSSGIEIARASCNYYTVNKNPKDLDKQLKQAKRKLYEVEKNQNNKNLYSKIENKQGHIWHTFKYGRKDQKILTFKSDLEKEWIKRYIDKHNKDESNKYKIKGDLQDGVELSLDQTYHAMKAFKAEQKSIFYELMAHIASDKESGKSYEIKNENHLLKGYEISDKKHNFEGINQIFSLFQFDNQRKYYQGKAEEQYKEFKRLTKNIQENGNAKDRGDFLFKNNKNKKYYFTEYGDFCEKYKKIAMNRGRLIAQIKGIEKETEEAKNTDYWSLIYVDQNHKQLWLIPKEKIQQAKRFVDDEDDIKDQTELSSYLCCFQSLTMRALHKLCFSEGSSFVEAMPKSLKNLQTETKSINKKDKNSQEQNQTNEQKRERKKEAELKFFKEVLKWQQDLHPEDKKKTLQIENFDLKIIDKIQKFEKFEEALEKACYYVKKIPLDSNEKDQFLKDYDVTVLNLTSYDLEKRNKSTHQSPKSKNKHHTDLWKVFWKNINQPDKKVEINGLSVEGLRLNPEIKIRFRKADENLQKYLEKRKFDEEFKKGRKFTQRGIENQFTASLTLALGKRYEDLAFAKPEDLCEKINAFNEKEINNKQNFETAWKYGIDRGQMELATLCLAKFDPNQTYQVNGKSIAKPKFASIKCYTLKDYNHKKPYGDEKPRKNGKTHRKAIENLSYFIDCEDLFKEEKTSCLDLTTAKVIKGKIVTNGDVMTYLKLKKVSAKRKLYELYGKGQIQSSTSLKWSEYKDGNTSHHRPEGVLNIKVKENEKEQEKTIYYFKDQYKAILSKDNIKNDLDRYLQELQQEKDESHTPSIQKINHLCKAITANAIGVITHLYKTYPGFVVLEDLQKGHSDFQHDASIFRDLEVALYNKFQSLSLVPPHVKDIIQLREDVRKQQRDNANKSKNLKEIKKEIENIETRLGKPGFLEHAPHTKIEEQKNKLKLLKNKESQYNTNTDLIKSSQIGIITFVDEENTSQMCPYCEKIQLSKESKEDKFQDKQFKCPDCGFHTNDLKQEYYDEKFQFLKDIDDPDKVAAYNIAKKLTDSHQIGKWKLPEPQHKEQNTNTHSQRNSNKHNGQHKHQRHKSQGHQSKSKTHQKNRHSTHTHHYQTKRKGKTSLTNQPFKEGLKNLVIKT